MKNKFYIGPEYIEFDNLVIKQNGKDNLKLLRDQLLTYSTKLLYNPPRHYLEINILGTHNINKIEKSYNKKVILSEINLLLTTLYSILQTIKNYNIYIYNSDIYFVHNMSNTNIVVCRNRGHPKLTNTIMIYYNMFCNEKPVVIYENFGRKYQNGSISINNNILDIKSSVARTLIYYNKKFESKLYYKDNDFIFIFDTYDNNIMKEYEYIHINYEIDQLLLINFIKNIKAFKNVNKCVINNKYDLMRYL